MKCPHCQRPVKLFNLHRSSLVKKVLPRCSACHRYVLTRTHKLLLALIIVAAFVLTALSVWLWG